MMQQLTNLMFWGNSSLDYSISLALFFAGFLVVKIIERIILGHLKKLAEKTATTFDDFIIGIIKKIGVPFAYFGVFYLGVVRLTLDPLFRKIINIAAIGIMTLAAVRFSVALISYGFKVYLSKRGKDEGLKRSLDGILVVINVAIWGLAIVFFMDNLGFKITAVIAGLGIGGVAVALAAQAVLGDLFSYFAILFDRPFEIGDFIITGDYLGSVEHIGIKTTRIRSLGGEQLIFSNTDLTNSRVRNYKRMERRRVVFSLGVTYQTPLEKIKIIPGIIQNIIKNIKDTAFDRAHFLSYGDFSLVFEIVYYVIGADYNKYMDIQQEINFAIKKEFEARAIEFAYPTQTLFVTKQ
ncbi:MAG: mechanosensitive ion channel family protein [Candidatus Omnitrophota bacterium]